MCVGGRRSTVRARMKSEIPEGFTSKTPEFLINMNGRKGLGEDCSDSNVPAVRSETVHI